MKPPAPEQTLAPAHLEALRRALLLLERTSFATQLSEYAGRPANYVLRKMPKTINDRLNHIAEIAILKSLDVAIKSIKPASKRPPATKLSSLLAGISGGVGGFLGAAALPVELPLTTIVMLRAIADIARHHGENLSTIEGRLACVEVFALGDRGSNERMSLGYYASRALLSKFTKDASTFLTQRGVASASTPLVGGFVSEVASRFGAVVSERAAASAIPVIGALGGATVNLIFMNHFQRIARGHFMVRRLERLYGTEVVQWHYMHLAKQQSKSAARTGE